MDIIITDRENKRKCSIHPLKDRQKLLFINSWNLPDPATDWTDYLLLHVEGRELTADDYRRPVLLIDASWKRALFLAEKPLIECLEKRSLSGFISCYPRTSKYYRMPDQGLASVEALYAAHLIQGREDPTLLDHYRWKEDFLVGNHKIIGYWRDIWRKRNYHEIH